MDPKAFNGIKCDRCSTTCGIYEHAPGCWRCPACIWKEREAMRETLLFVRGRLAEMGYRHGEMMARLNSTLAETATAEREGAER